MGNSKQKETPFQESIVGEIRRISTDRHSYVSRSKTILLLARLILGTIIEDNHEQILEAWNDHVTPRLDEKYVNDPANKDDEIFQVVAKLTK